MFEAINLHLIIALALVGCSKVENFNLDQTGGEPTLVVATLEYFGHASVGGCTKMAQNQILADLGEEEA